MVMRWSFDVIRWRFGVAYLGSHWRSLALTLAHILTLRDPKDAKDATLAHIWLYFGISFAR